LRRHGFSTSFIIYNPVAWLALIIATLAIFLSQNRAKATILFASSWLGLIFFGLVMIDSFKLVSRLWDPLLLMPTILVMSQLGKRSTSIITCCACVIVTAFFLVMVTRNWPNPKSDPEAVEVHHQQKLVYSTSLELAHRPFQSPRELNDHNVIHYLGWLRQLYLADPKTSHYIENIVDHLSHQRAVWKGDRFKDNIERFLEEHREPLLDHQ
jgi:hypothetical protein